MPAWYHVRQMNDVRIILQYLVFKRQWHYNEQLHFSSYKLQNWHYWTQIFSGAVVTRNIILGTCNVKSLTADNVEIHPYDYLAYTMPEMQFFIPVEITANSCQSRGIGAVKSVAFMWYLSLLKRQILRNDYWLIDSNILFIVPRSILIIYNPDCGVWNFSESK